MAEERKQRQARLNSLEKNIVSYNEHNGLPPLFRLTMPDPKVSVDTV